MLVIEFNSNGYSIVGDGLEIKLACSPTKFYEPIDQLYIVLIKALCEIKNKKFDIVCYNDSRIIDELNGIIKPETETSRILQNIILREIIPTIKGIIFFRKRSVSITPVIYKQPPIEKIHPYKKGGTIEKFKKGWLNYGNN